MLEDVIKKYNIEEDEIDYYSFDGYGPNKPWRHHVLQEPKVLAEYIESLGIIGATIMDIMLRYGGIYDIGTINRIDSLLELKKFSCDHEPIVLGIDIDTPITLVTDKGVFEFEFGEASTVTFAIDVLNDKPVANPHRKFEFDIRKIFRAILGRKIVGYTIETTGWEDVSNNFTGSHGRSLDDKQEEYIKSFCFKLDNGCFLQFNAFLDYGEAYLLDMDMNLIYIPSSQLKDMVSLD